MRIESSPQNSAFFTPKPFTVHYKYQNPYTHAEVVRNISLTAGDKFKIALATLAGLLLGIIGAPLLFFYAAKKLRERQIQEIKDLDPQDSKIQQAALVRLFGKEYADQAFVQHQLQISQLPIDWTPIKNGKCNQIKFYTQIRLPANQQFTESVVVKCQGDAPLKVEEIKASLKGKLDTLREKIISSKIDNDQQFEIRVVGMLKLRDGTWGYTHGSLNAHGQRMGDAFRLDLKRAEGQFKRLLEELKVPLQPMVDAHLDFID